MILSRLSALTAADRVSIRRAVHIEDAASSQSLIQELRKNSGVAIVPKKVERNKVARVSSITDIIEAGRVWLPATASWLDEFIAECLAFPASTHDDQVDAFYILVDALSRIHMSPADFDIPINLRGSLHRTGTSALDDLVHAPERRIGFAVLPVVNVVRFPQQLIDQPLGPVRPDENP
ncbi:phage terminase large subunit [Kistimonas scapharcae]|uniref:phage terminase large subunit n=1 Tax=Kistimonas scapharcae TaxID=1036133 RepID=UPI0031E502C4